MNNIKGLTATNWKSLEEFETRQHNAWQDSNQQWGNQSPLTLSEVTRLLYDVRKYKELLRELKREKE